MNSLNIEILANITEYSLKQLYTLRASALFGEGEESINDFVFEAIGEAIKEKESI